MKKSDKLSKRVHISEKKAKLITATCLGVVAVLVVVLLYINFGQARGYSVTTYSMGSMVQQTLYGADREKAAAEAAKEIEKLDDLISWRKENSDVDKINQSAGQKQEQVDQLTYDILVVSRDIAEKSDGALDITIAPVSRLWDFSEERPSLPDDELVKEFLPEVNYKNCALLEDRMVSLKNRLTAIELGALGKGAACDAAVKSYQTYRALYGIISVGGSVGVFGNKPFGANWTIAIQDPDDESIMGELSLKSGFVSTSGDYEKTFEVGGVKYHHILDPKTGYPVENQLKSVTVWSEQGVTSDALSTACFVLGKEKSLELLSAYRAESLGVEAVFIDKDNKVYVTEGLKENLKITKEKYQKMP